ncbi:MAG: family 43 glycosylhydrolase [Oscillospiraceae bacterium]|nr:family 43 glycosylhydrolase [Oscillospiraceae bacterium]
MRKIAVNPYLPAWEFVPDGEPHVFGDRIYVYGSHDEDGGDEFCLGDYVGWSAPVDDPGDWRYEGVIYRKDQDPRQGTGTVFEPPNRRGLPHLMFAPDCCQGPDGRYYLYYTLDFSNTVAVAVCDTPAGQFEFLGIVSLPDGTRDNDIQWFDPAVLAEESGVYLYVGSAPVEHFPGMPDEPLPGGVMVRLADDMLTIVSEPVCVANGVETAKGTDFEAHPFFEASSIRHFGDWYYFVYSSLQGHELCYAMSRRPEGPFAYKGVLVSNGDLGVKGNTQPRYYLGNNHGGIEKIGEKYYIFWHRHTHGGQFSRQGCADELTMNPDGTFDQAEITSCGLNGGPLPARGNRYRASIACHLQGPDRAAMAEMLPLLPDNTPERTIPYVDGCAEAGQPEGYRSWLANLRPGAVFGFKYLAFDGGCTRLAVTLRGRGHLALRLDDPEGPVLAELALDAPEWTQAEGGIPAVTGTHAVYFTVSGGEADRLDCADLRFS